MNRRAVVSSLSARLPYCNFWMDFPQNTTSFDLQTRRLPVLTMQRLLSCFSVSSPDLPLGNIACYWLGIGFTRVPFLWPSLSP